MREFHSTRYVPDMARVASGAATVPDDAHAHASERADVPEEPAEAPDDAYQQHAFDVLNENGQLLTTIDEAKIKTDFENGGVHIKATAEAIEKGTISISKEWNFGSRGADFCVFTGLTQKKKNVTVAVCLDGGSSPVATFTLPKQTGEDRWTQSKNLGKRLSPALSGKHTITLRVTFSGMSDEEKQKKVELYFKKIAFGVEDIPTVEFNIDESEGTIADMHNDKKHKTECVGDMTIRVPKGYVSEYGGDNPEGTYKMEYIRGRGNSTWSLDYDPDGDGGPWMAPKKPYKIKLEKKADLFGMGANKHWVMLAEYYDYTMLRNRYTYYLGAKLGLEFTPQLVPVNAMMNGEYLGTYYLCEQVRVGESRVNIDDLEDQPGATTGSAVTGGYLLSMDRDEDGEMRVIKTPQHQRFLIENPDFSENELVPEQYAYISDYIQNLEDAIFGKNFKNSAGKSYSDYMDVDSAIDYFLIQELSMNADAFGTNSTYLYKKRDGKLFWGPLWDFDYVAWGATEFEAENVSQFRCTHNMWFAKLLSDPAFKNKLVARWKQIKEVLSDSVSDGGQIDIYANQIDASQKLNYQIASSVGIDQDGFYGTYEDEISRLKKWIRSRVSWIDKNLNSINNGNFTVIYKVGKKKYKEEFYTTYQVFSDELPPEPTKKGYRFKGWYVKKNKKEVLLTDCGNLIGTITCYARWEKIDKIKGGAKIFFRDSNLYFPAKGSGAEYTIPYGSYPTDVPADKIKWKSSNAKKISVKNGIVTLKETGTPTATITATYKKTTIKCKVRFVSTDKIKSVTSFTVKKKKIMMKKKTYQPIRLSFLPNNNAHFALEDRLRFTSENPKIADVDSRGVIHAKKAGKTIIVVQFSDVIRLVRVTVKKK